MFLHLMVINLFNEIMFASIDAYDEISWALTLRVLATQRSWKEQRLVPNTKIFKTSGRSELIFGLKICLILF